MLFRQARIRERSSVLACVERRCGHEKISAWRAVRFRQRVTGHETREERLSGIEYYCGRFCGLAEFLNITMGVEARCDDGMLYTQVLFNRFFFWKQNLEIEIKREREGGAI